MYPKKFILSVITTLIVLGLTIGGFELYLRSLHTSWDPNGTDSGPRGHRECYRLSVTTGYEPIPSKCGRDDNGFYTVHSGTLGQDPINVLVLGDSIADQHRWVERMTHSLSQQIERPVETKNAGTPGFDTCSELQMYRDKALNQDFDLVLLQFCPNDLASTATVIALPENKVRFYIGWEYIEFSRWILSSRVMMWVAVNTLNRRQLTTQYRASSRPVEHCLLELQNLVEESGALFRVASFPVFVDNFDNQDAVLQLEAIKYNAQSVEKISTDLFINNNISFKGIRTIFDENSLSLEQNRNQPNDLWHPNNQTQEIIGKDLGQWLASEMNQ